MQRRAFLGRWVEGAGRRALPPYAPRGAELEACLACSGPCVEVCTEETGVLRRDDAGRPYLAFEEAGCTFCRACLEACSEGVLREEVERWPLARFWIDTSACLAHQGSVCVACVQACPEGAVKLQGMWRPEILTDRCTGCGLCVAPCPVEAVRWSG